MSISGTYAAGDLCAAPANSAGFADPGHHHSVVFKSLAPGAYTYQVGRGLRGEFRASGSASVRVGLIADVGATEPDGMRYHQEQPGARATYRMALARGPDLVLHLGDLSYAAGYQAKWDLFLDQVAPISARVPYMTAFGNYEQDWKRGGGKSPHAFGGADSGGECGVPTHTRFIMPVPAGRDDVRARANGWYAFSQGPAAFVVLNSEWNASKGSPQHDFLRAALSSVDRRATPWVVVGSHRPIYAKHSAGGDDSMLGYSDVEDLLREFEVDFMLYGHKHIAQRTCPIYRSRCTAAERPGSFPGTVHAVVGNGGHKLSHFPAHRAPWSLFQAEVFGFSELDVSATTAVLRFFGDSGELLDETAYSAVPRGAPGDVVV